MLRLDINIVWTILNLLIIFAIVKIFLIEAHPQDPGCKTGRDR